MNALFLDGTFRANPRPLAATNAPFRCSGLWNPAADLPSVPGWASHAVRLQSVGLPSPAIYQRIGYERVSELVRSTS